ncbi:MAG: hypothetical protein WED07_00915 [Candidatus Freyarchaeum deiterrae]
MSNIIDFFTGLVFGTILGSADKMGIKPMLLGRQSSKVLGPMIGSLAQQFIGKEPPKNMPELVRDLETLGKSTGVLGKEFELSYSENKFSMKIKECPWLEMAKYGKSIGYNACPLCASSIIMMGAIEGMGLSQVIGINVENKDTICQLKLGTEQE